MDPKPILGQSRALLSLPAMDAFHFKNIANAGDNFLIRRVGLSQNCNLIDRVPKVDGFFALYLPQEREVHFRLYDAQGAPRTNLADFLGACQVTSKDNLLEWSAHRNAMPLVTAGQQPLFLDPPSTLNYLVNPAFNPRQTILLPLESRSHLSVTNGSVCCVLSSEVAAHRVVALVEASQPALVVISQVHYSGWKATVDGQKVPLWRGNYAFQVVEVPPGKHTVELRYQDRAFHAGLLLTALTLLASVVFALRREIRGLRPRISRYSRRWNKPATSPSLQRFNPSTLQRL